MTPDEVQTIKTMMMSTVEEAFNKLDLNHDGSVSLQEMQTVIMNDDTFHFPPQVDSLGGSRVEKVERFFKMMDANSDGKITLQEMQDCASRMIDEMLAELN